MTDSVLLSVFHGSFALGVVVGAIGLWIFAVLFAWWGARR